MRKGPGILLFVMTLVVMAYTQDSTCGNYLGTLGPYRCPNPGCHQLYYVNRVDQKCVAFEECDYWLADTNCCGAYTKWVAAGYDCLITEMKDPSVREHLVELAKTNDVLVPTCGGAYVPARIAFRQRKHEKNDVDGL